MLIKKIISLLIVFALCAPLYAIHLGGDGLPWSQPMEHKLDKPLNDKYNGKNFFMNLGPTGIRAKINQASPKLFEVKYVFQDAKSPARKKIQIGDKIIGANGNKFKNQHRFHRKQGGRGWVGPPYELALAIEDSQGKDGKLSLMVLRKGQSLDITLQLKKVGRFSETYPADCPRSDKLLKELCDFMIKNGIDGKHHYQIQQLLALWSAGDKRAMPLVKAKARELMRRHANYKDTGMVTWGWGYTGIFLGEYYNMTKDKKVLPAVNALKQAFELGIDHRSGGFSHRPFPFIQQRMVNNGPKGYGAMASPGGLSMVAQSIFRSTGLPYSERAYQRTHQGYLASGKRRDGAFAYGFDGPWHHAVIKLKNNKKAKSPMGIGYEVPEGMEEIDDFSVVWPTKADPRYKPTDWIKKEAHKNLVFDKGDTRLIIREMTLPEPTHAYNTIPGGADHPAAVGMGAIAHHIGNQGNTSWNYLGKHFANCSAYSYKSIWDGHADAPMHAFFAVLGAAKADEAIFRKFLDYSKTWIILSETHDGGLVEQPFGCQRNSTCSIKRDRSAYTHVAVLLLSLHKKNLLITGKAESKLSISSKNNPVRSIQSSSFIINLCKKEADTFTKARSSFLTTLKRLDKYSKIKNAKGREATVFASKVRAWISKRNKEVMKATETSPASTLEELKAFIKLMKGMEEESHLKERLKETESLSGIKTLTKIIKDLNKVETSLSSKKISKTAMKRAVKQKQTISDKLHALIQDQKTDEKIKSEAKVLLGKLSLS